MAKFPESYKDPLYASLDAKTEQKLGLPSGLLSNIRVKGERSNHSQVSEAAASGVYQFIPSTKAAIVKKYGIDPDLSPENASEAAGLLLKEGLDRNKGDAALAVAEYTGGLNRAAWGPKTKAYTQRVMADLPTQPVNLPAADVSQGAPSTFDQVMAQQGPAAAPQSSAIANIYAAYKGGQMNPEQSAAFESDVKAGKLMPPRGATLGSATPQEGALSNVIKAYSGGQMNPEQAKAFEADIASGAVKLPEGTQLRKPGTAYGAIPDALPPAAPEAPATLGQQIVGAGEAGLTALTGAVGGTIGTAAGAIGGLSEQILNGNFGTAQAADLVEQSAAKGAQALTYQPRTQAGQNQAEALGGALQQILPVTPLTGELGMMARGAAPVTQAVRTVGASIPGAAADAVQAVRNTAGGAVEAVRAKLPGAQPAQPTAGTLGSVGAAATDMATQRNMIAESLPVPVKLTKGQAERTFEQQRFEQETAKDPNAGAPLRERYADQNDAILKNFDSFVDLTGAEAPSLRATGIAVDAALVKQYTADKAKVRTMYKEAEKAGEMADPVDVSKVVEHLNDSAPDAATAPLLDVARRRAVQLGLATETDGQLVAQPVTLKTAETYRQAIGRATDYEATNVRQSSIIKNLLDESTDGAGGEMYKAARKERARLAQNYENRAGISKLLNTKRGTSDRQVALEDVFEHTMLKSSLDDMKNMRRVLHRSGPEGEQAWHELQGATINWLKAEATKNVATDIRGNQIVSAAGLNKAIRTLDADDKLKYIFTSKGAQQLRDLNDLAKVVYTAPPGSVNSSNTASVILAALTEMGVTGSLTGLPVPALTALKVASTYIKDRKLAARINEALGKGKAKQSRPTTTTGKF